MYQNIAGSQEEHSKFQNEGAPWDSTPEQVLSWDGSRNSLTVVYPIGDHPFLKVTEKKYLHWQAGIEWRKIKANLAKIPQGVREITYFDPTGLYLDEFWDGVNPLHLRKVTMSSPMAEKYDPLRAFLRSASQRFRLRITEMRLVPFHMGSKGEVINDNWFYVPDRSMAPLDVNPLNALQGIYGSPNSARNLQALYGVAISGLQQPAILQTVAHALKDLKVIVTPDPHKLLVRPPLAYQDLTPEQQARANLFLNAFPGLPISFH